MRILVTGGSGFIGSHLVEHFQGKAEVRVLDSLRSGYRANLDGFDVEFIEGHTSHQPLALPTRKAAQELPVAVAMALGADLQEAALSSVQSLSPV